MRWVLAAAALAASGVAGARPATIRTISYETGPCFGACPVYKVTVSSDGTGVFEGRRFTAVTGERRFRVSPAQWRAFERALAPVHGRGHVDMAGPPLCREMATDQASVDIRWSGAQRPSALHAYYGCDMEKNRRLFDRIARAPEALPIAPLIKSP